VLLISGARDSVTPPSFADRVAKQLPNSRHIIFPEASHGNWGFCGIKIMSDFFDRGSATNLDISCVAQQKPTKFNVAQPLVPVVGSPTRFTLACFDCAAVGERQGLRGEIHRYHRVWIRE
jgi:hypothetical protein